MVFVFYMFHQTETVSDLSDGTPIPVIIELLPSVAWFLAMFYGIWWTRINLAFVLLGVGIIANDCGSGLEFLRWWASPV